MLLVYVKHFKGPQSFPLLHFTEFVIESKYYCFSLDFMKIITPNNSTWLALYIDYYFMDL